MKLNNAKKRRGSAASRGNEFQLAIRVYYEDTDAGGVVYHANYLRFMERARTEWLRKQGYEQDELRREGIVFAVRSAVIEYVKPACFNELLNVSVEIRQYRGASVDIHQAVSNQSGEILCEGDIRVVCVEADSMRPRPFPKNMFPELSHVG